MVLYLLYNENKAIIIVGNFKITDKMQRLINLFIVKAISCLFLLNLMASDAVLLVTADVHGNIISEEGGFLRLSSAIKTETEKEGRENVILIDCGDTLQGSFESSVTKGGISIDLLNELGYDFWIPGNHDFDYGFDVFLDRGKAFKGETLCSNIVTEERLKPKLTYTKWAIVKKKDIKIAIIGSTLPDINSSVAVSRNPLFRTVALSSALRIIMPKIMKENPDVIVLALHGGIFNKNWSLAKEISKYPQIDLVLGGHTHEAVPGKTLYNGVYYLQPGHGGDYLGVVKINANKKKGRPEFISKLIPTANYPPDSQITEKLSETLASIKEDGKKTGCLHKHG